MFSLSVARTYPSSAGEIEHRASNVLFLPCPFCRDLVKQCTEHVSFLPDWVHVARNDWVRLARVGFTGMISVEGLVRRTSWVDARHSDIEPAELCCQQPD